MWMTRLLGALLSLLLIVPAARADTPITLFKSFAGTVNFTGTQESLRTKANGADACSIASSVTMTLAGLPTGSTVLAAYLYWAGSSSTPDYTVTFDGKATTAPTNRQYSSTTVGYNYFAAAADVTAQVKAKGNANYTATDLTVDRSSLFCAVQGVLGGFQLLVVYNTNDSRATFRVLNVYEGLQYIRNSQVELTLANFLTPSPLGTQTGRVGALTWEGDSSLSGGGENLLFNGNQLVDSLNPVGNQFNSISNINNDQNSFGIDFDAYTIASPIIASGQKSAKTTYQSGNDLVLMNAEIIAAPNVQATDRAIAMTLEGPLVESTTTAYTLVVSNNGPLAESGPIVVTDTLPSSLIVGTPSGTGWSCVKSGQTVTCTYDMTKKMAVDEKLPAITIPVTPVRGISGLVTNSATVGGPLFDYYDANDTATLSVRAGLGDFTPQFMFTTAPCVHNKPFGDPEQTCRPVNFDPSLANTDLRMYISYVVKGVPTAMSNVDTTLRMKFAMTCHNPTTNAGVRATYNISSTVLNLPLCENGGAIPGQTSGTWSGLNNIVFGAGTPSTKVEFQLRYQDVGRVELLVSDSDGRLGSTGSFVSRPEKLLLQAPSYNAATTPALATNPKFAVAGDPFALTVQAMMPGLTTPAPNFGRETEPVKVLVTATPAATASGPIPAMVVGRAPDDYFDPVPFRGAFNAFVGGVATGTTFAYDDVGVLQLDAALQGKDYLGSGNVAAAFINVGRFVPAYFNTVVKGPMACVAAAGCPTAVTAPATAIETMAYSEQPFEVEVQAMGRANNVLQNYRLELARDVTLTAFTQPNGTTAQTSPTAGSTLSTFAATANPGNPVPALVIPASAFAAGIAKTTAVYAFPSTLRYSATAPSANNWPQPISAYVRAIESSGSDAVTSKRAAAVEGGIRVVAGRMYVPSAQGAADQVLAVPVKPQFFGMAGGFAGWYDSNTDSTTSFVPATGPQFATQCAKLPGATSCNLALRVDASTVGSFTAGAGTVRLAAPGTGSNGSLEMWLNSQSWLPSTKGVLTYGVVRSPTIYTYIREMY